MQPSESVIVVLAIVLAIALATVLPWWASALVGIALPFLIIPALALMLWRRP